MQLFHQGQLVATHVRKPAGKQTDMGHYPPEKIAFRMRTPTWCRTRAAEIGPATVELIGALLEVNALFRLRAAQGVLGLAQKRGIGPVRLEAACAKALQVGDPSYRTVKGILAAATETQPAPPATGDGGASAHLHGPTQLFATVSPLATSEAHLELDSATATANAERTGRGDDQQHRPDPGSGGGRQAAEPEQEATP